MIIVTGAAGFIGSCLVSKLNSEGFYNIIVCDDFSNEEKNKNLIEKKYLKQIHRDKLFEFVTENQRFVEFIFHIGARTDTAEQNVEIFNKLNLNYTKQVWNLCCEFGFPLVYASSAATYGLGEHGYDDETNPELLNPLNPYGESKNDFDKWALAQIEKPYFFAGLKFFNVYGPNEYHKGRMASVVMHAFDQIQNSGKVKLFKSHNPKYKDGEQLRDFVYVKDLVDVCYWLMHHRKDSGLYNLGTGKAETFLTLVNEIFKTLNKPANIEFIDTPSDIRNKYQYFTEAKMDKLRAIGYIKKFRSLSEAIPDYVNNYLLHHNYF